MDVTLQLATENNFAVVMPLICSYHEIEEIKLSEIQREKSVRKLLSDNSLGGIWLVYADTELVGYIALCTGFSIEFAGLDAFVDEFYIDAKFRNQGIGAKVLELIKVQAGSMNIRAIHLEVARENITAKSLYSKADFKAREKYVLMSFEL